MKALLLIVVGVLITLLLVQPDEFATARKETVKAAKATVDVAKKVSTEVEKRIETAGQ